jgi:hypothetical protein
MQSGNLTCGACIQRHGREHRECGSGTFVRTPEGDNGFTSTTRTEASAAMSVISSLWTVSGHSSSGVRPSSRAASTPLRHAVSWHDLRDS